MYQFTTYISTAEIRFRRKRNLILGAVIGLPAWALVFVSVILWLTQCQV